MKYLLFFLTFVCVFLLTDAKAQFTEVQRQVLANKNIMNGFNPGFENGKAQWTASGGTFTTSTTAANVGSGNAAGQWTASGVQTLTSAQITIPSGLYGQNCLASLNVKGGDTNLTFRVIDGSSNVLASVALSPFTTYSKQNLSFICPSSGSIALQISAGASAAIAYFDDGYIGGNFLIGTAAQANFYGSLSFTSTGSCDTSVSSGTLTNFSDTTCTTTAAGKVSSFGSTTPGFQMVNAPPGEYYVVLNGGTRVDCANTGTTSCNGLFAFSDGTTTTNPVIVRHGDNASINPDNSGPPIVGHFSYTTTGTRSINFQGAFTGSGAGNHVEFIAIANTSNSNFSSAQFLVYYFPSASQQVFNPNTTAISWSGYHPQSCQFQQNAAASHAYQDFGNTASSCEIVTTVNNNFGSVVSQRSGGNYLPGIVFTPKSIGTYQVCAITNAWDNSSASSMSLSLEDTNGTVISRSTSASGGAGHPQNFTMCDQYVISNLSQITIKLTGAGNSGDLLVLAEGATNLHSIEWNITNITYGVTIPFGVGSGGAEVFYTGGNGEGSTNTSARRFTTATVADGGSDITVNQSATNGDSFITNTPGIYAITYCDVSTSATGQQMCLAINPVGNNSCDTSAVANILAYQYTATQSGNGSCISVTHKFAAGDAVQARSASPSSLSVTQANAVHFRMVKISTNQ